MRRRKLVIALCAAALFGVVAMPASAELHRVAVTLVTGQTVEMTVDVPPGGSVQSVALPSLPAPVASITDLGPVATPAPTATTTPAPTTTATPAPTETPAAGGNVGAGEGTTRARDEQTEAKKKKAEQKDKQDEKPAENTEAREGELEAEQPDKDKDKQVDKDNPTRNTDGSPTLENPTVSVATPGPARPGVPNFFIEKFRIPPFLLSIYQAAGIEYGVRWEILAAINEIETDYGRNLNVSSAGALGWMQFMPATWDAYGVDGNRDGKMDPYNPVDAIFAAARYLKAAGADRDLRAAIFAYNHADWYVDSVLLRARLIGGLPSDLVGSLTGLTQGRFPVAAKATYAKEVTRRDLQAGTGQPNAAYVIDASQRRDGIKVYARAGAPVVAVNDGRIVKVGRNKRLGDYVKLQDVYGNTYTYGHLGKVAASYATPKQRATSKREIAKELRLPAPDAAPERPASRTTQAEAKERKRAPARRAKTRRAAAAPVKERLFAHPERPNTSAAGADQGAEGELDFAEYLAADVRPRPLRDRHEAAARRRARARGHDPRPDRKAHAAHRAAPAVRDPARGPGRAARRPEADPRRLEAARVDGDLPRGRPQPVLRRGRPDPVDRPDPADGQGRAGRAGAGRSERPDLRLRPPGHPHGPRSIAASWRRSSSSPPPGSSRRSRRSSAATPT